MADFPARLAELKAASIGLQELDLKAAGEAGGDQALTLSCYSVVFSGLEKYDYWREQALAAALGSLDDLDDETGAERHAAWQDSMAEHGAEAMKMIVEIAKSVQDLEKRASKLRLLLDVTAQQEPFFFAKLASMPLARLQGTIQEHEQEFRREAEALIDKWEALGDRGRPVADKAATTLAQIRDLFDETAEILVAQDRDLTEKVRNVKIEPDKPITGGIGNSLALLLKGGVQVVMTQLETYRRRGEAYSDELAQLFGAHELVVIYFAEIRGAVRQFLARTNLRTTIAEFTELTDDAFDIAASCPTDAQKVDARRFVELAKEKLAASTEVFETAYGEFVSANRGLFVGPAELTRLDELLQVTELLETWKEAETANIQSSLTRLLEHSVAWEVSVEGLSDEEVAELKAALVMIAEPLSRGIVAVNDDHLVSQLGTMISDKGRKLRDWWTSSPGGEA